MKNLLKTTRNKNKKQNKIVELAISKLHSMESKIFEALINSEISYEEFMTIINEEKNMENWKKTWEWWIVQDVILKIVI